VSVYVWPDDWPDSARDAVYGWIAKYGEARDALEAVVAWENYTPDFALGSDVQDHYNDFAHAKAVLEKHPRPYLDTSGKWVS
jgi:hypothetical protein